MVDREEPGSRSRFTETSVFVGIGAVISFTLVVTVGLAILAAGMAESEPGAARRTVTVDGQAIYEQSCANCHGADGEGGIGPTMIGIVEKYPDVAVHELIVSEGRGAMPSFKSSLNAEQIAAVVAYEREAFEPAGAQEG